jgi:hypothetical protein
MPFIKDKNVPMYLQDYDMKKVTVFLILFTVVTSLWAQKIAPPHLEKKGNNIQLIVNGDPFLVLGGELHNSSTSGAAYMRPIWNRLKRKNLNTVIAPVYWELIEPREGSFDFSLVDSMIYGARMQNLHLVILWFGSWKNGYSMYVPGWVKNDTKRFARVRNQKQEPFVVLSTFSEASMKADAKAFKALMQHIRKIDEKYETVIMAQVENEVGLFYEPRDHSLEANKAYEQGVPVDLMRYLVANKGKLQPELDSVWKANGYKTAGTWEEIFGESQLNKKDNRAFSYLPEELFTVYYYSKYIGKVAKAGKEAYAIPMYVNAWIKQQNFHWPGKYPSGGPIPHTLDIWRFNAPDLDFISPDIYVSIPEARDVIKQYHRSGNPLFIPEFKPGAASANLAFWAYGEHNAIGFSPFGIDETAPENDPITKTYAVISQVQQLILKYGGKETMAGIYVDTAVKSQSFDLNGYNVKVNLAIPLPTIAGGEVAGLSSSNQSVMSAGGFVFASGANEFIVVGKDFTLRFTPLKPDAENRKIDIEYMDEGAFLNKTWVRTRRLNGDEGTGGGDYGFGFNKGFSANFRFQPSPGNEYKIVKFKLYRY